MFEREWTMVWLNQTGSCIEKTGGRHRDLSCASGLTYQGDEVHYLH